MNSSTLFLSALVVLATISLSHQQSCGFATNTDNAGTTFQTTQVANTGGSSAQTNCCNLCNQNAQCRSWTYDCNSNMCMLKSSIGSPFSCQGSNTFITSYLLFHFFFSF